MSKMRPEIWNSMSDEAQAAYSERNDRLWELSRAVLGFPASGDVDEVYRLALQKARYADALLQARNGDDK